MLPLQREYRRALDFISRHPEALRLWGADLYSGEYMHPVNDKLKVHVTSNEFGFGDKSIGVEKGIVVEVPDKLAYFGFHSFAFESSLGNADLSKALLKYYSDFKGKLVFWEALQDRGRRFKEDGEEYVFLNMTDIIAYSDDPDINVEVVDQTGSAGSFNL